jgi:hypothetical protein
MAPKVCPMDKQARLVSEYYRCQAKPKSAAMKKMRKEKLVLPPMPRGTATLVAYRMKDVKKGIYRRRPSKFQMRK